jgi:hypothetical protein
MPRIPAAAGFTIDQLERILQARRGEVRKLAKKRDRIARQLQVLDRHLSRLGGGPAAIGTGRGRNEQSLVEALESVLKSASKPMQVADITSAVQQRGYRSSSANFRGIVNQTLIKEKRFGQAGRGLYQLAK